MRLSVVIPAFNEARRLPTTLTEIIGHLEHGRRWQPSEVVVVDDGSIDGTAEVVAGFTGFESVTVRCLRHDANRGKGAAVRTGFAASRGELVLLSDADLATPIDELDRLADAMTDGAVIGSRALDRDRIERRQPIYRDLMGRSFNLAVRLLAVPGIHDTQCGFKLFDGTLGRRCAELQQLDGFAYDVELLLITRTLGREVVELPVRWRHVDESRVRPVAHSLDMLADLLRLGWRRIRGRIIAPSAGDP